jgi:hypothetical protein
VNRYWIKSLSEWAPGEPAYSCTEIDDAIKSMETVRQINKELREALEEAVSIIRYLDYHIIELEAKISLLNEDSN